MVVSEKFKPKDLEQPDQLIPPTTLEKVRKAKNAEQGGRSPRSTERKKSTPSRDANIAILECLKSVLLKRGRQGKVALARAALELSEGGVVGDVGTGVHWEYWRNRWFTLSRDEQFHAIRAEILPMLLKPAKGPPSAERWPNRSRATKPPPAAISGRAPTPADTVRHLRELGNRCLGGALAASIARILSIEHLDEKRNDSG